MSVTPSIDPIGLRAAQLERTQSLYRFLSEANALIARSHSAEALYQELCSLATRLDPQIVLAWVGLRQEGSQQIRVVASSGPALAYLDGIDIRFDLAMPASDGPTALAMRENRCVFVDDFLHDPLTSPWQQRAREHGIAASANIPIQREQQACGALMLYGSATGLFDDALKELFVVLGATLSYAIDAFGERARRDQLMEELRRSETRYRLLTENIKDVISVFDIETSRLVYVSPSVKQLRGYSVDEVMAQSIKQMLTPASLSFAQEWLQNAKRAWEAGQFVPQTIEIAQVRRDGSTVWTEVSVQLDRDVASGRTLINCVSRDISERRALFQQIEQSKINLHSTIDAAEETILMIEADGRIIAINKIGAARLGSHSLTLVGKNIYDLLPQPVAEDRRIKINSAIESGKPLIFEDERNGRIYRTRVYPIVQPSQRAVIYAVDITDSIAAERRLKESEQRYRSMFENSYIIKLIIDPSDGSIFDVNEAASRFYGWTREELRRMSISDLNVLSPEQIQAEMTFAKSEQRNHFEFRHRLASGAIRDVEVFSGPLQVGGKDYLYSIVHDVTDQRRNIRRIQALLNIALTERTMDEREFLGRGLELAESITDSQIGFLHFVNDDQESIELVTWTAGALKGCTAAYDNHYPISKAGIWADCFRQLRPVVFNDYASYAQKHGLPDGHAPLDRLISVPVIEQGKVRMMIGVGNKSQDYLDADIESVQLIGNDLWRAVRRERVEKEVTENLARQRELNHKLEEAHNQLLQSEKMASIGQLAAGVAHELNNPIGFVHSNLGTLDEYLKDIFAIDDAYLAAEAKVASGSDAFAQVAALKTAVNYDFLREDIGQLMAESREGLSRVKKIVQDLKEFSRVGESDWQWADVHKGLDSTLNIVWNEIKYKSTVSKDYDPTLPLINCLPSQLNQVFMNLLVNAAQAIEVSSGTGSVSGALGAITLRTRKLDDAHIQIEIADTGKGIPPEHLNRIFEPFFTTKPVGKGTGLGLSIAWGIIGKHHGKIDVESTVGVGTRFTIVLPVNPVEEPLDDHEHPSA